MLTHNGQTRRGARVELRGEIVAEHNGRFILRSRESTYVFDPPRRYRGTLAIGHRVFLIGYHAPNPGHRAYFHATWAQASHFNYDQARSTWLALWKASGGPQRSAPLERWSRALVIGTRTAVEDVAWWFDRCGVDESEWFAVETRATPRAVSHSLRLHVPKQKPDVIVLVRGGGEGVHLYDDLDLVKEVVSLQEKIPVVVGIGHANQFTLADEVAISQGTPSYAAQYLVSLRDAEDANRARRAEDAKRVAKDDARQAEDSHIIHAAERAEQCEKDALSQAILQESNRTMKWKAVAVAALLVGAAIGAVFGGLLV